jgi:hypothetical protein
MSFRLGGVVGMEGARRPKGPAEAALTPCVLNPGCLAHNCSSGDHPSATVMALGPKTPPDEHPSTHHR